MVAGKGFTRAGMPLKITCMAKIGLQSFGRCSVPTLCYRKASSSTFQKFPQSVCCRSRSCSPKLSGGLGVAEDFPDTLARLMCESWLDMEQHCGYNQTFPSKPKLHPNVVSFGLGLRAFLSFLLSSFFPAFFILSFLSVFISLY